MLKLHTSYFYQIRFFKPFQIPISTAVWDPKWFHDYQSQDHKFIDKRGVVNGFRCEALHPAAECEGLCHGRPCQFSPDSCEFLKSYRKQIFRLDREKLLDSLLKAARVIQQKLKFTEDPELIFIVHEAPANVCSERAVLQDFFECTEFQRSCT